MDGNKIENNAKMCNDIKELLCDVSLRMNVWMIKNIKSLTTTTVVVVLMITQTTNFKLGYTSYNKSIAEMNIIYEEDSSYEGVVKFGKRNGEGTLTLADGVYHGSECVKYISIRMVEVLKEC